MPVIHLSLEQVFEAVDLLAPEEKELLVKRLVMERRHELRRLMEQVWVRNAEISEEQIADEVNQAVVEVRTKHGC